MYKSGYDVGKKMQSLDPTSIPRRAPTHPSANPRDRETLTCTRITSPRTSVQIIPLGRFLFFSKDSVYVALTTSQLPTKTAHQHAPQTHHGRAR